MKDLTIIIPIIEFNDEEKVMYQEALESAKGNAEKLIVVGGPNAIEKVEKVDGVEYLVNDTDDTTYCAQVNFVIDKVKTKYFSVLEFDDKFNKFWFSNVEQYIKNDIDDMFGYLPLTILFDCNLKGEVGFANEAYWASSFSEEIGYLDLNSMLDYFNFNVSGAIFKTEEFKTLGGLKASMKLTFWYEFLLRALHKGKKMYVIPKAGCIHRINRIGSISEDYAKNMSDKEADFWFDLAKREYMFTKDRKKVYEEE